ncbi:MAG: hypothetical protein LUH05_04145 [Candidatus Gastranaerophilales bacterium]|nr:hypothetical protein [Candidatus Gastranaerophilales bacterium]
MIEKEGVNKSDMTTKEQFKKGTGDWDKLFDFMDKNNFTCLDFLLCICSNLKNEPENEFKTEIKLRGTKFKIEINKE